MTERARALAEFDRQHNVPPGVSLVAIEIGFWNLVNLLIKLYFAAIIAAAIVAAVPLLMFLLFLVVTGPVFESFE